MEINWFTFAAQILNFLVLVWLLKRFLYGPIISAMDQREETIRSRLEAAERKEREAQERADALAAEHQELADRRDALMAATREKVEQKKKGWTAKIREEVEEQESRWRESVRQQQEAFFNELRERAVRQVVVMAGRIVDDLADEELEQQILDTFIRRLEQLDPASRQAMRDAFAKHEDSEFSLYSSFEITDGQRDRIQTILRDQLGRHDVTVHSRVTSNITCGVALKSGGWKLGWSVDDYLGAVEEELQKVFQSEARRSTSADGQQVEVQSPSER